jgi:putative colanic acid biosynthesis acetyltransferase WcaB
MMAFRLSYAIREAPFPMWLLGIPVLIVYRISIEWILGVEIPFKTKIGKGLSVQHGQGLVINDGAVIGEGCTLRNNTTIGVKIDNFGNKSEAPIIGNNVNIGANVVIIGPVSIGDNVIIGAGTVIVKSVPANSTVVGNPSRIIKSNN